MIQIKPLISTIKTYRLSSFWMGLLIVCVGCKKQPDFSLTPFIEFENVTRLEAMDGLGNTVDTVVVSIRFQDGDGDLGVEPSDFFNPKYADFADPTGKFLNYYIVFERKNGAQYNEIMTSLAVDGTILPLIGYEEVGPIEGVLNYGFLLNPRSALRSGFSPNDTVRFRVSIVDRALNVSNQITTSDVVLFQTATP